MPTLQVFDPPMCCSTGVCGPEVDPALTRFAADFEWLSKQGITVQRYNLAQEPGPFMEHPEVRKIVEETGGDGLPAIIIDGQLIKQGEYPLRQELAERLGLNSHEGHGAASHHDPSAEAAEAQAGAAEGQPLVTPAVAELIAIGAAIAANCDECFEHHYQKARELGVSHEDMIQAANLGLRIRQIPSDAVVRTAQRYLAPEAAAAAQGGGCCGPGQSC